MVSLTVFENGPPLTDHSLTTVLDPGIPLASDEFAGHPRPTFGTRLMVTLRATSACAVLAI